MPASGLNRSPRRDAGHITRRIDKHQLTDESGVPSRSHDRDAAAQAVPNQDWSATANEVDHGANFASPSLSGLLVSPAAVAVTAEVESEDCNLGNEVRNHTVPPRHLGPGAMDKHDWYGGRLSPPGPRDLTPIDPETALSCWFR